MTSVGKAIGFGLLVWLVPFVIDSPLMLLGGPMKMSFAAYMADIGLTYLIFPIVTWGLGSVMSGVGPRA